ncbi:MAG: F0F1 ATP synthase subunit epsilon [Candidatus Omnitrophica bacterium]|nr:F0F1 ATP synthase subunit epsilon [Candidatus Omnitrophota bacterium]
MAKTFKVSILTPDRVMFNGDVSYLLVPGGEGSMGILPDHASLLSTLSPGSYELRFEEPGKSIFFKTKNSGFIQVDKNIVSILLDSADSLAINAA